MAEPAENHGDAGARSDSSAGHGLGRILGEYPSLVAVGAATLLGLIALGLYTPRYETNDDVMLNLIAAGRAYTDRPDEHLLFMNVALGWPLSRLYSLAPTVPWYGLGQFAALLAAAAGTAYALLGVNRSARQAAVVALYFGVAVLPCIAQMQYTKTAFLVTLAGILLFLAPLRGAAPWPRAAVVAAGLFMVLGSLIRFQSFLLAGLMAMPVALAAAWSNPRAFFRRLSGPALTLGCVAALYLFNRGYYARDPEWKDYYSYYAARSEFTDFQRVRYTPESEPAFQAIGWEKVDWEMLMTWFFADRERYSLGNLRHILSDAPAAPRPPLADSLSTAARALVEAPVLRQVALATICVSLLAGSGWTRFALPCALFGLAFLVAVLLRTYFWSPPRVLIALYSGVVACAGLQRGPVDPSAAQGSSNRNRLLLGCGLAFFALWLVQRTLSGLAEDDSARAHIHANAGRMLRKLAPRPDQLFIVWREQFPFEDVVAPLENPALLDGFRCLALSCVLDTPFTERRQREFQIDDVYRAVWERPDVSLVTHPDLLDYFRRYAARHYGVDLEFLVTFHRKEPPELFIVRARPKKLPSAEGQ